MNMNKKLMILVKIETNLMPYSNHLSGSLLKDDSVEHSFGSNINPSEEIRYSV